MTLTVATTMFCMYSSFLNTTKYSLVMKVVVGMADCNIFLSALVYAESVKVELTISLKGSSWTMLIADFMILVKISLVGIRLKESLLVDTFLVIAGISEEINFSFNSFLALFSLRDTHS